MRSARREFLQPGVFVEWLLLAIDPSVTQGFVERFRIGDGWLARSLLVDHEPNAFRAQVVFGQPLSEAARCLERLHFERFLDCHYLHPLWASSRALTW